MLFEHNDDRGEEVDSRCTFSAQPRQHVRWFRAEPRFREPGPARDTVRIAPLKKYPD